MTKEKTKFKIFFKFIYLRYCLTIPGLSKDIQRHEGHHTFSVGWKITNSDTKPCLKWTVSLVIAGIHFNLSWGCLGIILKSLMAEWLEQASQ